MRTQLFRRVWSILLVAAMTISFTSCSDDKDDIPQLPNMKTIECKAGDRCNLTFSANSKWYLSSDSVWCKFETSGGNLTEMQGNAGAHNITLIIGNEQIRDQVTTAKITITMGSHRAIIAEVKRAPKNLYVQIYNIANEPIKSIPLAYNGYTPILIEANFDFTATDFPEWVSIRDGVIAGYAGEQVEAYFGIVNNGDRERWPIKVDDGYTITFSDLKGEVSFSFPLVYNGMGEDNIIIEGPTTNNFGWEVTSDGKSFSQENDEGGITTFENELSYNIIAQSNKYHMVYIERVIERGIPSHRVYLENDKNNWMHFDKERMALTIDSTENIRYGQVLALSEYVYNLYRTDIENSDIFEMDNSSGIDLPQLRSDFLEYVIAEFTQRGTKEADPNSEMHIYHSITAYEVPATRYTNTDVLAEYGVSEAYIAPFVNSLEGRKPGIVINPRIEGWNTENYDLGNATVEVKYKNESLKMSNDEFFIGENVDELLALQLNGPKAGFEIGGENIYILFKVNGEAKKLLIVTPPTK